MNLNPNPRIKGLHVYPGHPITVAIEIMDAFPNIAAANEKTVHGWPAALSCSRVSGAGGAVYSGLDVVRKAATGEMTPDEAWEWASTIWDNARQSDFADRRVEGQEKADTIRDYFIERVTEWSRA